MKKKLYFAVISCLLFMVAYGAKFYVQKLKLLLGYEVTVSIVWLAGFLIVLYSFTESWVRSLYVLVSNDGEERDEEELK